MIDLVKVVEVEARGHARLWLRLSDGRAGEHDLSELLAEGGTMVEPLRDAELFARVFVESGVPSWPNGFDLDAIALYREMDEAGALSSGVPA